MKPRTFIIAEAGVNHNGSAELARQLVLAARDAGADAVKFQTFKAARLVTEQAAKAEYQKASGESGESQFAMLQKLEMSEALHFELRDLCNASGIEFMSTAFDEASADFLAEVGLKRVKVPSGEITNLPFLRHLAAQGLPILLSTGMANLEEVREAIACIRLVAADLPITVLQCVSNYPARPEDVNLRAMLTMREEFQVPVGYSDHTPGIEVSIAAVALGATVIEKHVTLDRSLPGPDHAASLLASEFAEMVRSIRAVEAALGDGVKRPVSSEAEMAKVARKSLVAARDIPQGAALAPEDIAILRPGTGLPPAARERVIGRAARSGISAGTPLTEDLLA